MGSTGSEASVVVYLYENIENMAEIKDLVMKGQLKASVVNPSVICHTDQLVWAAHKSLLNAKKNQLKTKSIYTELLYNLFPTKSIRDSLKTFGTQDKATSAIFVMLNTENEEFSNGLKTLVKGSISSLDKLAELRNTVAIRKLYKVPQHISDESSLLSFVLSRMASKDLLF